MSGAPIPPAQLPSWPPLRLDLAGWTREATQGDPRAFMALFEEAERLGYDGVWFNEFRLAQPPAPYPSPLLHERRVFFAARRGVPAQQVVPVDRARALREQFVHGTPESCARQIHLACERTGARQLRLVFNGSGVLGNAQALAGMRLFAREAMPALRA